MDEFELQSKLNGFYYMPKKLTLLLFEKKLSFNQFGLLQIYVSFADWDITHKNYAIANISDRKIATILELNKNKVRKNRLLLYVKGYIEQLKGTNKQYRIRINNPEQFFTKLTGKVPNNKDTVSKYKST